MTEGLAARPQQVVPSPLLSCGIPQAAAAVEIAKAGGPVAQQADPLLLAALTIVPGVIFAVGGLIQIALNYFTKLKRIEIETRLRRLEMGLPCEDHQCPIQKLATRRPLPPLFGKPKTAKPDADTVDLP